MAPLARAGSTCWRIARTRRVALLLDNQTYFSAVCAALKRARRSVLILGWQFDPRTTLARRGAEQRERIGDVLRTLAAQRPELDIRVLVWDMALPISATRARYPQRAKKWFHGRVRFQLDDRHPAGASHHQKLVIIDDALAFCSGGDFDSDRWDSSAHVHGDPRRRLTSGKPHPARHDAAMAVDGDAAAALGDLARERWLRATGERLSAAARTQDDPWPEGLACDLPGCPVAIARTEPAFDGRAAVGEVEALHIAAIAAAQRLIYIENQYLVSPRIGRALEARLAQPQGPHIVAVLPRRSPNYFDRLTMDGARDALVARLAAADRHGRFRAYSPVTAGGSAIIVHAKVTIVDDRLLRLGSANLNNRSMGLDTECDLAIDAALPGNADSARIRTGIEKFLHRLVGHYVEALPEEVARAAVRRGGLAAGIEALRRADANRLEPLLPQRMGLVAAMVAEHHLGDPEGPADVFRPWRRRAARGGTRFACPMSAMARKADSVKALVGDVIAATDGEIGRVDEVFFDDREWRVCYVVVDAYAPLAGRKVLLSTDAIGRSRTSDTAVGVDLTRAEVAHRPSVDSKMPVSRLYEEASARYYAGTGNPSETEREAGRSHLRSSGEVIGYSVHGPDGLMGHVDDLLLDGESWTIKTLLVGDIRVSPEALRALDWKTREVRID